MARISARARLLILPHAGPEQEEIVAPRDDSYLRGGEEYLSIVRAERAVEARTR